MNYSDVIEIIANNLLRYFDEVYHSAEIIVNDKNIKMPAVALNKTDEWLPLVPTDQREIVYIRRAGEDEVQEELKIGSCIKSYKMRSSLRIVFFKDHASNHAEIIHRLTQSALSAGTKLKTIIRDKWKLQKDESSGDYTFGATTAYYAVDIYALWELKTDSCPQDFCLDIANPLKKEPCPVVA